MRLLLVLAFSLSAFQVHGKCVRYSTDFLHWSASNNYISEELNTVDTNTETTTGTSTTGVPDTTSVPTTTTSDNPSTTTEGSSSTTTPLPTTSTPTTTTALPSTSTPTTTTALPTTSTQSQTDASTTSTTISITTTEGTTTTVDPYSNYQLTTVVISGQNTNPGQAIFLRGGLDYNAYGCTDEHPDACMIPIVHVTEGAEPSYIAWAENDNFLDWDVESGQGSYEGWQAQGTPGQWEDGSWVFEFLMDCDSTDNGWFEIKGFFQDYNNNYNFWEDWINDYFECAFHGNHQAICGQNNYFTWNYNFCEHY